MVHFGPWRAAGGGPVLRGSAAQDEELPEAEEDTEGDRHGQKGEAIAAEGGLGVGEGPGNGGAADDEGGDHAEDAPSDASLAGALAPEDDAEADADHREVPKKREKQAERLGARGEAEERNGAYDHEERAGAKGADGQFFQGGTS